MVGFAAYAHIPALGKRATEGGRGSEGGWERVGWQATKWCRNAAPCAMHAIT